MVRAILAGTKTQTRRVVKTPEWFEGHRIHSCMGPANPYTGEKEERSRYETVISAIDGGKQQRCPYGSPWDRLWVKETFSPSPHDSPTFCGFYRATDEERKVKWKPSIFMPRALSRITLEIVSVHVERLQEISEHDATWEGIDVEGTDHDYCRIYRELWESINGRGSWALNPWLWVVEFKKLP